MEKYDITDYLKDDKELQKAVIEEFLKEIAELKAENDRLKEEVEELHKYIDELKEQLSKSVSNDLTLVAIKDFFQKVLNGEV